MTLNVVGPSTPDEYLLAFWTRQKEKNKHEEFPDSPEARLNAIFGKYPYKFPCEGKCELAWYISRVSSAEELGSLWMHKSDTFLMDTKLLPGSLWLKDLAQKAIETKFFEKTDTGSCGKNYYKWKDTCLKGQLADSERPLLVRYPYLTEIVDGFGRLLPYLALCYQGREFHPFDAFLAVPK